MQCAYKVSAADGKSNELTAYLFADDGNINSSATEVKWKTAGNVVTPPETPGDQPIVGGPSTSPRGSSRSRAVLQSIFGDNFGGRVHSFFLRLFGLN